MAFIAVRTKEFEEKEQAVFEDLSALIKDAKWLRHFMAIGLKLNGEALVSAAAAFGATDDAADASTFMASLKLSEEEIAAAAATNDKEDP